MKKPSIAGTRPLVETARLAGTPDLLATRLTLSRGSSSYLHPALPDKPAAAPDVIDLRPAFSFWITSCAAADRRKSRLFLGLDRRQSPEIMPTERVVLVQNPYLSRGLRSDSLSAPRIQHGAGSRTDATRERYMYTLSPGPISSLFLENGERRKGGEGRGARGRGGESRLRRVPCTRVEKLAQSPSAGQAGNSSSPGARFARMVRTPYSSLAKPVPHHHRSRSSLPPACSSPILSSLSRFRNSR